MKPEQGEDFIFTGEHSEQLGCGLMKGPGDKFSKETFDPQNNDNDKRLLDEGKVHALKPSRPVPTPEAVELAATDDRIDLDLIEGSGEEGRVIKSDVEKALKELPPIEENDNEGGEG